jgi:hypothetical protein
MNAGWGSLAEGLAEEDARGWCEGGFRRAGHEGAKRVSGETLRWCLYRDYFVELKRGSEY